MRRKKHKFIFILFFVSILFAQIDHSVIILHHADISSSRLSNEEVVRALIGNVSVTIDTVDFYCDSAFYFPARDVADFYGNVKIVRGEQTIFADFIKYFRIPRKAIATGTVTLIEPGHFISARKIIYFTQTRNSEGFEHVVMNDSVNQIFSTSEHYRHFPQQDSLILMQNVVVHSIDKSTGDTTTIFCDTLQYINRENEEKTYALGHVKVLKGDLIARSEFAAFYISGDSILLREKPVVTVENNKIQAKNILIRLRDGHISSIALAEKAEMKSVIDSLKMKEDILQARYIDLFFEEDSLRFIVAKKNAVGRYNILEEGSEGLNYVTADTIKIFIRQNKADSLFVRGGVEGTFYPEKYRELAP